MFCSFGFGFDTASEIALLGVSALARAKGIPSSEIIILPLLFTAGMTAVDSADSVFMLLAYSSPLGPETGFGSGWTGWRLFETRAATQETTKIPVDEEAQSEQVLGPAECTKTSSVSIDEQQTSPSKPATIKSVPNAELEINAAKMATLSGVSIGLTIISIVMALVISIVR
jgi:high-affinity nickel-transport protein